MSDNVMPFDDTKQMRDIPAEQATLGAILLRVAALPEVAAVLSPEDFYMDAHRILYECLLSLTERGEPAEVIMISADLQRIPWGDGQTAWDFIGKENYLLLLMESCTSPSNASWYAQRVLEKAICRRTAFQSQQAFTLARSGDISALRDNADILSFGDLIGKANVGESIQIEQVGDFVARLGTPPPMLVEQVLPHNSLFLLTAKPKHCKSFVALDIADSVCLGEDVFGEYPVNTPGPVVFLAMEDGEYEVLNRVLQHGIKMRDERPLYFCTARLILSSTEALNALKRKLEAIKPVLLIIDTAAEATGIQKWEDRGEVTAKLRPLREFSREVCSVLLIAHNRKSEGENGDEIAGSNAFTGAVDGWLSIYEKRKLASGNVLLFLRCEGRGGVRGEIALEMDTRTLRMKALTPEEIAEVKESPENKAQDVARNTRFQDVARAITAAGKKATIPQIGEYLEWEYPMTHRIVKQMLAEHLLEETGEKIVTGGKGKPAPFYQLTPEMVAIYQPEKDPFADESRTLHRPDIGHWMDKD